MALTPPTAEALEVFSGVDVTAMYTDDDYVSQVLQQAADLLYFHSDLKEWPEDADSPEWRLVMNAMCEMAQALYLGQKYKPVVAAPFSSETIGNYTYAKAQRSLEQGVPTGLSWFDLAITRFNGTGDDESFSRSTHLFDDSSTDVLIVEDEAGDRRILGPANLKRLGEGTVYGKGMRT